MTEAPGGLRPHHSAWPRRPLVSPSLSVALLVALSSAVSYFLVGMGLQLFVIVLGSLLATLLLAWVSLKDLSLTLLAWMLTMGGFRGLIMVYMPGLPDFSFDRVLLSWIILMFVLRAVVERRPLRGPFLADAILVTHTVYVLVQLQVCQSIHFHAWVISNLSPMFGYLYGKNIVENEKHIRNILVFFLLLTVYYYIESVAEQFHWNSIIWPKAILDPNQGFYVFGRSRGPLLHPPLFGQVLSMFLMVYFFYLGRRGLSVPVKVLLAVSFALACLGLFYTYTRGPWLSTFVGIMVLAALRPNYRRVLVGLAVAGFFAGLVGVSRLANTEFLQERIENVDTVDNRLAFLSTATRMIRDHPIFGVGFFRYNDYRDAYNQTVYIPFYGIVKKAYGENMPIHDIYLGRLAEEGLVSVLLLAAFAFVVVKAGVAKWRANPTGSYFNRDLLALFAGMAASYLVGGMIIDYRYFDLINVILMLMAGIVYGYRGEYAAPAVPRDSRPVWLARGNR